MESGSLGPPYTEAYDFFVGEDGYLYPIFPNESSTYHAPVPQLIDASARSAVEPDARRESPFFSFHSQV